MKCLGLITARGGSKSIPHKNIAPLLGRPLLAYTAAAALASQLDRVVISTDDSRIAQVAKEYGVEAPFLRPSELASDQAGTLPVVQHTVRFLEEKEGYRPDYVMILQPTSPLRSAEHINAAIQVLRDTHADSVVSVIEVPHNFNPVSLLQMKDGRLKPFLQDGPTVLRRQDKPKVFARNGPVILATSYDTLMRQNSLFGLDCRPLLMDLEDSVDIDGPFELELAEWLISRRQAKEASTPGETLGEGREGEWHSPSSPVPKVREPRRKS